MRRSGGWAALSLLPLQLLALSGSPRRGSAGHAALRLNRLMPVWSSTLESNTNPNTNPDTNPDTNANTNRLLPVWSAFGRLIALGGSVVETPPWLKVAALALRLALIAHVVACGWFLVGRLDGYGSSAWLPAAEMTAAPLRTRYLQAVLGAVKLKLLTSNFYF